MSAPLTSIVILTRNQLEYTRDCVASIERCTPEPHQLVFVDNGSTDGTLEYVRGIAGAVVIENDRNLGFGGGCNQGIAISTGERVLLLNNDVVVTPGWLGALHAALDADPATGLAGPRSNRVAGAQQLDEPDYDVQTLDGLDEWAVSWTAAHAGETSEIPRLVGFCLLLDRAVIERVGGFDLRYGLGNFEDDDLCLRAAVAGWRCRVAHDSWVHHVGSRTFAGEQIDYRATMADNLRRFAAAWQCVDGDVDPRTGAYRADRIIARTSFDAGRHYAPLVARPDDGARVELGERRARVLAVCCDRTFPDDTQAALSTALEAFGPDDGVTVAVRVDPRDTTAMALLEETADSIGDPHLPDIAIVELADEHDGPLLRAADAVLVSGRAGPARAGLARHLGVAPLAPHELRAFGSAQPRRLTTSDGPAHLSMRGHRRTEACEL